MENYLSTKELAKKLNVPLATIYFWIAKNEIPHIKIGKHHRFLYEEVLVFFKNKTTSKQFKTSTGGKCEFY